MALALAQVRGEQGAGLVGREQGAGLVGREGREGSEGREGRRGTEGRGGHGETEGHRDSLGERQRETQKDTAIIRCNLGRCIRGIDLAGGR